MQLLSTSALKIECTITNDSIANSCHMLEKVLYRLSSCNDNRIIVHIHALELMMRWAAAWHVLPLPSCMHTHPALLHSCCSHATLAWRLSIKQLCANRSTWCLQCPGQMSTFESKLAKQMSGGDKGSGRTILRGPCTAAAAQWVAELHTPPLEAC